MKRIINYITLLLFVSVATACVRDEILPCPPLQVNLAVKDKNYFNVDKVESEERVSEDLAFQAYVPTLYYRLCDVVTGELVEERGVFKAAGEGKTYPLTFPEELPHGTYVLTVWGGLDNLEGLSPDRGRMAFHPEQAEGNDVYLVQDTLVYDAWNYEYTAELERTKGKLVVEVNKLPVQSMQVRQEVTQLFGWVDALQFIYGGESQVTTASHCTVDGPMVWKTLLAPSVRKKASVFGLQFFAAEEPETPLYIPDEVAVTMERNCLTVLRYVYDGKGAFTIYILVNDNWELVHGMEID